VFATTTARADDFFTSDPATADGRIVLRVVQVEDLDGDPKAAGKQAAEQLKAAMGDVPLRAVIVSEVFEGIEYKQQMLAGINSVIDPNLVLGGATYGSFTHGGCTDFDAVTLLGIGGEGIGVSAGLVTEQGAAKLQVGQDDAKMKKLLRAAGQRLAEGLDRSDQDQLLILIADAHSPKNQYLVEGTQTVLGEQFPITGGSANKNAGQTYVYFRGKPYQDATVGVLLSGKFDVALAGRKATDNDAVIATAREGAAEALDAAKGEPLAVLAFNCAGRRSKLDEYAEELEAIQAAAGKTVPLFGLYCAGEIGPVDLSEKPTDALSGGSGWHVMFSVIAK
jgi:hypothetical protein